MNENIQNLLFCWFTIYITGLGILVSKLDFIDCFDKIRSTLGRSLLSRYSSTTGVVFWMDSPHTLSLKVKDILDALGSWLVVFVRLEI